MFEPNPGEIVLKAKPQDLESGKFNRHADDVPLRFSVVDHVDHVLNQGPESDEFVVTILFVLENQNKNM
jgi:hypothetical protein